jgi:hypothetical protein
MMKKYKYTVLQIILYNKYNKKNKNKIHNNKNKF